MNKQEEEWIIKKTEELEKAIIQINNNTNILKEIIEKKWNKNINEIINEKTETQKNTKIKKQTEE